MRVINLSSGSKGNLTYIEGQEIKILLDIGLSCQETIKRLERCGINPTELDAILITHEHSDHIKGLDIFSSKFNIPVFAHEKVWQSLQYKLAKIKIENRKHFEGEFSFGTLKITPIELPHDVACFGYSFEEEQNKISIVTDLGHINDRILNALKGSKLVYLEANYDRESLLTGTKYPLSLKRRIDGPNGHLSNLDSSKVIEFLCATGTRQIVLSHLSEENNSPLLAYTYIKNQLEKRGIIEGRDIKIDVATQSIGAFFRLK